MRRLECGNQGDKQAESDHKIYLTGWIAHTRHTNYTSRCSVRHAWQGKIRPPNMTVEKTRQKVQQQKELPTLTPSMQRILVACEDQGISQTALAEALTESPTITARILGLANSAFFGQRSGVHTLPHAISVLGLVTVRSIAAGLTLSGRLDTQNCPAFRAEYYWLSAVLSATLAQRIAPLVAAGMRPPQDTVYLAGLLHNLGLLALVHLHPAEMDRALTAYAADPQRTLGPHIRDVLETDHYQAGVWLGSKWHFPRSMLLVMEHRYDPGYRGDHWPLVVLQGLAARWANCIIDGKACFYAEPEAMQALGLTEPMIEIVWQEMSEQLDRIRSVAAAFSSV